ncbi:MAG: hypothetical protein Q4D79_11875 [Propionibacteriaceae bacterium]|nr:hypothetical protein [Propionibacteriaceae bacterium]
MGVQYRGEPEFIIEGIPSGIRERGMAMRTCSDSFSSMGESLAGIETEGWVGRAADRFRSRLEVEPSRWTCIADGFQSAASALEGYADALDSAQRGAQVCKENYEEGNRVSEAAKAQYDRDVLEATQKKAAWEGQNGPGTYTLTITPFADPGQALRDRAIAEFNALIDNLEKAASDAAQAVRQSCVDADDTRQWPDTGLTAQSELDSNSAGLVVEDAATDKEYGKLDPAIVKEWEKLSTEDRKRVLQAMVDDELAKYGVDSQKISFEDKEKTSYGLWNEGGWFGAGRKLMINQNILDDPQKVMNTAAHEARHAGQHEIIRDTERNVWDYITGNKKEKELEEHGVTREEVDSWKENFDDYKKPEDDFDAYFNQPVEQDAREAGRDFINSMTPEDFAEYKRKAGVK